MRYLAGNREPDYFWCPLLALFLGVRLGEVVNLKLAHIGHIEAIDVWYIDVVPDAAKNANSVRRLPVPDGLKALGFIDYVKHVRRLSAEYLFPHRDWSGSTARRDPSKNQSRRFGEHLDQLGISDPLLVFHSFRHTVVTALQDAGVPLGQAMQIVGHEAQSHAVKTGVISQPQARSVHLAVYTHADLERLGTQFPLLPLKAALERSIQPPINYPGLLEGAAIVQQHLKKVGSEFRSGWAPQRSEYVAALDARVRSRMESAPIT